MGQITEAGLRGMVLDQIEKAKNLVKKGKYDEAWHELNKVLNKLMVLEDMADGE